MRWGRGWGPGWLAPTLGSWGTSVRSDKSPKNAPRDGSWDLLREARPCPSAWGLRCFASGFARGGCSGSKVPVGKGPGWTGTGSEGSPRRGRFLGLWQLLAKLAAKPPLGSGESRGDRAWG